MFGKSRSCHVPAVPERVQPEYNVAVLGAAGSGKSALTVKFLTKRFISEYDPNLEDIYSSEEVVDQQPVVVKVMDTADQDGPVNCERYLSWAGAFLVVYSIDDRLSFEGCQRYLQVVTQHSRTGQNRTEPDTQHTRTAPPDPQHTRTAQNRTEPDCPVILLGNKLDMERYRQVSKSDGSALASRFGCLFFEVSACLDFPSVQRVFHEAVREARREGERGPPPRYAPCSSARTSPPSAWPPPPPPPSPRPALGSYRRRPRPSWSPSSRPERRASGAPPPSRCSRASGSSDPLP